jgi:hypothetical protein
VTDDLRDVLRDAATSVDAEPDPVGLRARLDRVDRRSHAVRVGAAIATVAVVVAVGVVVAGSWTGSHVSHRIAAQPATSTTATAATTAPSPVTPTTVAGPSTPPTTRAGSVVSPRPPTTLGHCTASQLNTTGAGDPASAGFQGTGVPGNPVLVGSQHGQTYTVVDAAGEWSATLLLTHLPYRTAVPIRVMCSDRSVTQFTFTRTG